MRYFMICPVGVIGGKHDLLTYASDQEIPVGAIVEIPFGQRQVGGIVMGRAKAPNFATKSITSIYPETVPLSLLKLAQWMADYYATRLSLCLRLISPSGINKKRRQQEVVEPVKITRGEGLPALNSSQKAALKDIQSHSAITYLLHGVTGSGKTRVYQELVISAAKQARNCLVLVPEIALTPQLLAEFMAVHNQVIVIHSGLSEAQRHLLWRRIQTATEPLVVIGPRSALFVPLNRLSLIIVDEAHEGSYVQDSHPKYSALRVARKLAEQHPGCKLILGSATPNLSDYYLAQATKAPIINLKQPTVARSTSIQLVDSTQRQLFSRNRLFSQPLLEAMNKSLAQSEQVMIFHNRRATARTCLCEDCGWIADCTTCHLPLRLHHDINKLRCHICGKTQSPPTNCPECQANTVIFRGLGIKQIELELGKLFPQASIARFDSDNTVKNQVHNRYQALYDGDIQIIIGTQGIVKGLDLPKLTTVGIVQAESELLVGDYSSAERSFQLITQAIGRVGRTGRASQVIIQTNNPKNPVIEAAKNQDYQAFYRYELANRQAEFTTPFSFGLQLINSYASDTAAQTVANKLAAELKIKFRNLLVRGPSPAFHQESSRGHHWQLLVFSTSRQPLVEIARHLPAKWQFQLDPPDFM